jgi:hypothetical protein
MIELDHFDEKLAGGGSGPTIWVAGLAQSNHPPMNRLHSTASSLE